MEFFLATVWLKGFFLPMWEFFFLPLTLIGFNIIILVNDICSGVMLWVSVKRLETTDIVTDAIQIKLN